MYAAIVVAVGGLTCLYRLGDGMLIVDEAWFAVTTEHMLRSGDYIVPTIGEPYKGVPNSPHLNAAPLYNWLCCLTADVLGEGALRYRLWSGLFGIGCALAALALASLLFGAEAGLIAGLMVVTNLHFLFIHGIRDGRMDPALALFVTMAVIAVVKAHRAAGSGVVWWAVAGISLGCGALMKPPVFAGFFCAVLSVHHMAVRRELTWRGRLRGPIVAAAVAAILALPWYVALYSRLGWPAVNQVVFSTSVGRAVKTFGESRPWWFYLVWIWQSSLAFKFVGLALAWGVVSAVRGAERFAWGLLSFLSCAFLIAISISVTRHWQYVYPIYPVLAVAVAGLFSAGLRRISESRCLWRDWLAVAAVGLIAAGYCVRQDYIMTSYYVRHAPQPEYPPLLVHKAAERELAAGNAHLVLFKFPVPEGPVSLKLGFGPSERLYPVYFLAHAVRAKDEADLSHLIADGKPTVVFLPPFLSDSKVLNLSRRADFRLYVVSRAHPYPVLAFNGADAALHLREVLAAQLASPKP